MSYLLLGQKVKKCNVGFLLCVSVNIIILVLAVALFLLVLHHNFLGLSSLLRNEVSGTGTLTTALLSVKNLEFPEPLDVTGPALARSQELWSEAGHPHVSPGVCSCGAIAVAYSVCVSVYKSPYFLIIALSRRGISGHKTEPLVENPGEQHK